MLYEKLGRPALGKTVRLVSRSAAEEIVQDVFTKGWQKGMVFPDLKHAYAWVYRCCTNAAIDHLRSKNSSQEELSGAEPSVELAPEERALATQAWKLLIGVLDEDEAAVFIYRVFEGLTQEEIVEVMGISRRTVNRLQERVDAKLEAIRRGRHVA